MIKTSALSRVAAAALAVSALSAPLMAQAADGPWLVRARAVHLDPANRGDIDGLDINTKTIPEVDITYFFTPNIAAELILTYPQKQDVTLNGGDIGTLKHLPPTLSAQYHFNPEGKVRPYVSLGVNYTRFSSVHLLDGAGKVDKSSFGLSYGAGMDVQLSGPWYLNVDVKKVGIKTDVSVSGTKLGTFKVDPLLFGVGIGYRF
ncbi:MAG: OmpW family protein [Proteobacteria bacterium]|uniref:OmpW family protein n=1 Tax=Aquabacterium sp. TaxID=1872578 RepID=UPI0035C69AE2|nr:OmpW family protein [Pseudomonadota bacterium]